MSRYPRSIITKTTFTPTGPTTNGSAPGIWTLSEAAYWTKQGLWPNANIQASDTYFPYVSLLLSTTSLGNANNNLFVDSSGAFNPISRNGNTTQGSFTPYSTNWSNYFDGTSDSLTYTGGSSLNFGTSDFTIELWAFLTNTGTYSPFIRPDDSGTFPEFGYDFSSGQLKFDARNAAIVAVTTTMPTNQWVHVAASRSGTSLRLFVNGTQVGSTTTNSTNFGSTTGTIRIGGSSFSSSHTVNGYLSNFRVVKGTAVYTANFTPPTSALTAISGTSLLTCQSNRFRDASTNNFTITVNGNTSVQDFNPFSPAYPGMTYNQSDITNWSGYFDGSGDYLVTPSSSQFAFGTGDYTLEGWFYTGATGTERRILYFNDDRNNVDVTSSNTIIMYDGSVRTFGTPVPNAWNHFAVSRASGTVRCYLNGVLGYSGSETSNTSTRTLYVGANSSGVGPFNGYLSNLRVVKGTAVYTGASLTVPTTPLTAISGTSLLTLQNAAFTDNSTNNFVITINGNTTATGNSPFDTVGYWSNYFDGSGDYLSVPSNAAFDCGTGDWTIEGWVNIATRTTNYPAFFSNNRGAFATTPPGLAITVSNSDSASYNDKFVFAWGGGGFSSPSAGSAYLLVANATNSVNTWYHLAVVRNGTSIKMYRNGTEVASATISSGSTFDWGYNGALIGGGNWDGANSYMNGYVSNFRFVKGTAVYTAAFTPPTSPLTAISGTSLLTCQNGRYIDNSTNAFTVTRNGDVTIQSFDPFYTATIASNGGSMYFDGSGDYLALQNNPSYALGPGDFTLEVWVYPIVQGGHGSSNNDCIIDFRPGSNGAYGTLYIPSSGASVNWYANTANRITGSAIPNGAWSHLCVSRVSGSTRLFINGVQSGSTYTDSTNYLQTNPWIGQFNDGVGSGWFQGYMSGMRIVKGTGVSSTFTPPTVPQTPTAATTLLLNGMNAGAFDATAINDMETVGNAQTRNLTPFPPANYYAGYFDGSGDYLATGTSSAIAIGTSDFTYECWVYPSSYPNDSTLVYAGGTSTGNEISLQIRNSQVAAHLYISGVHSDVQFTDLAPALNQWSHLAISRVSGVLYGFLNGVRSATAPALTANFGTSAAAYVAIGNRYAGSISNARITKNVAVYSTATYTVPTSPLEASANTAFLTCQNKTFIDNSPNALPITVYGGATAGVSGPFIYTGASSAYFNGGSDRLQIPITPAMYLGTTYTIEGWAYSGTTSGARAIFNISEAFTGGFTELFVGMNTSGVFVAENRTSTNGSVAQITGPSVSINTWYHVALSVSNTSAKLFVNGTQVGSTTTFNEYPIAKTTYAAIGGWGNGWVDAGIPTGGWIGYLDDVRITKGVARYTSNFTPPTQAFPPY